MSGVAIGSDADVQLMNDVSKWGRGRFYFTEETSTVPRIFTLETQLASKASLIEQPFKAIVTRPHHGVDPGHRLGEGAALGGYVATSIKGTADQLLMTHQEDPLLAAVALRAGTVGGVHRRRQGEVGHSLAPVGRVQQVLGSGRPVDAPREHAQRHHGERRPAGRPGRRDGRRDRPEGRLHQLPGRSARRGQSQTSGSRS